MKKEKKTINVDLVDCGMLDFAASLRKDIAEAAKNKEWHTAFLLKCYLHRFLPLFKDCREIINSYAETWSVKKNEG